MDHRWDHAVQRRPDAEAEQTRFHGSRIARDPDVEDRQDAQSPLDRREGRAGRIRPIQQLSPWEIGLAFHDQRDLYTVGSRTDAAGYGLGPHHHPDTGSYAYPRTAQVHDARPLTDATLPERRAWPWLNYHDVEEDPFYSPPPRGIWARVKEEVREAFGRSRGNARTDARIREAVTESLSLRTDLDTSDVEVGVHAAEVTLEGTVPDGRMKRLAEESAGGVRGVRSVRNHLGVRSNDDPGRGDPDVAFALPLLLMVAAAAR